MIYSKIGSTAEINYSVQSKLYPGESKTRQVAGRIQSRSAGNAMDDVVFPASGPSVGSSWKRNNSRKGVLREKTSRHVAGLPDPGPY